MSLAWEAAAPNGYASGTSRNEPADLDALFALFERPPWMADAACKEHAREIFYPVRGDDSRPAKQICARCLVRDECLAYAIEGNERFGVWGGTSERERRRLRRSA